MVKWTRVILMSERGSFVTNFIYNKNTADIVYKYFSNYDFNGVSISAVINGKVVAGMIHCSPGYPGEENVQMEFNILPELAKLLNTESDSDSIVVSVIPDNGELRSFLVGDNEKVTLCK